MNNVPEEDPKLLNFLSKHRSIVTPASPELEDRLMAAIDLLPEPRSKISRHWWRNKIGGIGLIAIGALGIVMHQIFNPPQPSLAELQQLNRYLEAYAHESIDAAWDLDSDLFTDGESDSES